MSGAPEFVQVRAQRGWDWVVGAHALFAKARLYWLLLILGYWLLTIMLTVIPVVGVIAATLLKPVFAVGFLAAAWAQERGEPPNLGRLFAGFRSNVRALLPLGVVYAVGIAIALAISSTLDGGALMRMVLLGDAPEGNVMAIPGIQSAMLLTAVCAVPTLLALWFAPALIVFQDQPTFVALGLSLRASLANLSAVLIYAMSVFLFWVVIPGIIISLCAVLFGQTGALFGMAVATPITISVVAMIHIADYVVYRDLFHHGETIERKSQTPVTGPR
ncbi:MAG: BPSS1780 family membrane protein [Betaproteobacteria bacterium]